MTEGRSSPPGTQRRVRVVYCGSKAEEELAWRFVREILVQGAILLRNSVPVADKRS